MTAFRNAMQSEQMAWKTRRLAHVREPGLWQGRPYDHILPPSASTENLWAGLRGDGVRPLESWLRESGVQPHKERNNLLSSWTLCANLYFAFGAAADGRAVLASFLRERTGLAISEVTAVELEYALPKPLDPGTLLGERDGRRGANQTSPDVAFEVLLDNGHRALVLTEVKFVEHFFYPCSGYKALAADERRATCLDLKHVLQAPAERCVHAAGRGRRYWEHLAGPLSESNPSVRIGECPAARGGYQLFRQQALAEALAATSDLDTVVSSVAYDGRNSELMQCMASSGVPDITNGWAPMFVGRAQFTTWTHQDWYQWVARAPSAPGWVPDWLDWVGDRYGYRGPEENAA